MKWHYWILVLVVLGGCKDKFVVNVDTPASGFLVVEGFININGTTDILLTRSSGLDSPQYIPEPAAQVEVQSANGNMYPLTENYTGHYSIYSLSADPAQQYRLHIKTANGREYLSDFSVVKITPPIDSLNFTAGSDAVNIYVSTHDAQSNPGYYQWQFEETWEYHAAYNSGMEYRNGSLIFRPDSEEIYSCWRSDLSTSIIIANTEKLTSNTVYQYPLTTIPYNSTDKLVYRYSILVKEVALTKDWYEWNQKVKRNTEQLGTIFDAQPSETGGNIHCTTDPSENVIGFIGTTTQTEKRIFIDRLQLPPVNIFTGYEYCDERQVSTHPDSLFEKFNNGFNIPISPIYNGPTMIGVYYSGFDCVDCQLKGGTLTKPSFWQ
jgi:hypothetical protein